MPGTFPILELRQDGDVAPVRIKQSGAKPSLKDIQSFLKRKTPPTQLASYAYEGRRLSFFAYTTGKEAEQSQHQLPPPVEAAEAYGSIVLIVHSLKAEWDAAVPDVFTPADYEVFYEKACSGELEDQDEKDDEDDDEEEDVEEAAEEEAEEEEEEEEEVVDEDEEVEEEVAAAEEDEEVEAGPVIRATRSRKAVKVDASQLQFQYVSNLVHQDTVDVAVMTDRRVKACNAFKALLGSECSEQDILELERGVFNATLEEAKRRMVPQTWDHETFRWIYTMLTKRVASNFTPSSYVNNGRLMERWKEGEFNLDMLGSWSPYELDPDHWKDLKDQQFRREQRILEGNLAMATDRFRCSRCQKKMCTYYELQTRSADEPMTIFITCVNCGKNWRQ